MDGETFGSDSRFLALERLGSGAAGEVFRVIDRRFRHEVALKTLFRADPAAILRFKNEFRSLADVVHPNLAQLYELQTDGSTWFFTMEMVPGVDLLEWVRGAKAPGAEDPPPAPPPDEPLLRAALLQLVQGLAALHAAGKLHCDLKPSNLRVTPAGRVVLLDFGLVREIAPRGDQTFELAGTPAYMSPEQLGGTAITPASDLYAVGVLLFELLTGRRPHVGSFAQILHAKLTGQVPSPSSLTGGLPADLVGLCEALLRHDPAARPSGGELLELLGARLPAARPEAEHRFVGRERHLAVLETALSRCLAGRASVVWVHGSSGMGKSALVANFVERARERRPDLLCLQGRCYERESVPYKALDALLDALARHLRHLPAGEAESLLPPDILALARLFPALHSVEEIERAQRHVLEMPDEREQRRRAHGALRELLRRLAQRQPLVLVIDDLQWGDRDSAGLLAELLRPPEAPPFLLLGCFRSEERESSPLLQALLDSSGQLETGASRELEVAELDPEAAASLARHLLAERARPRPADDGIGAAEVEAADALLARSIARESQGSPFFVGELVEHAVSDLDGSADTLPKFDDDSTSATLDRLIVARLRRLPAETRRLLEVVALAGRPLELEVALEVAALGFDGPAAVATLRAANLIRIRRLRSHDAIEPYHDRIREAVARRVERQGRPQLHRLLAERLEKSDRSEPETIASHWREAGEPRKESYWVAEAAAGAARALAFERAAGLYARALDLAPPEADGGRAGERHALRLSLGQALADAGRGPEAAAAFLAAVPAAAPEEGLELRRRAAEQQLISGHIDDGLETARGVLASIGMVLPRSLGHTLFGLIGKRLRLKLRGLRFRERPAGEVPPELLLRIDTCRSIAMGLANVQPMLGMSFATSHLLHALAAGEPYRLSLAMALEAAYSAAAGSKSQRRTARLVEAAGTLADKVASPHAQGMALFGAGIAHYFEGRPGRALDFLLRADTLLRERCTGVSWERDTVLFYSLRVLRLLGKVSQIRGLVPATLKDVVERGDLYAETCLRSAGLWICELSEDRPAAALQEIETARGNWSQEGFHPLHYVQLGARIDIANYEGDGDRGWAAIEAAWPRLERSQMLRFQLVSVDAHHLRARAAFAAAAMPGKSEAAKKKLLAAAEASLAKAERPRLEWARPFHQQARAVLAAFGGEKEQAAELLTLAAAGFDAGSFELPAALCRRRHGELAGGAKGAAQVAAADAWMARQGIRGPSRFAAAFLPGPW